MKFNIRYILIVCFFPLNMLAENIIYESNFGKKGITGRNILGLRQVVDVTDLPGISKSMRLTTISKGKKHFAPAWNSTKLKITKSGTVTVDYYVKQCSMTGRYGLFVSSESKKQLVAVIFNAGKILYNSRKQWHLLKSYELNKWYHIRYILHTKFKTFDIYIDNMTIPMAKNIAYRNEDAGYPTRVWIPGAVLQDAVSEFTHIQVRHQQASCFPSPILMQSPYYLIALGDRNIEIEPMNAENMPAAEKGTFTLSCNEKGLLFKFHGKGKYENNYRKKSKPWANDCIEIFLDPGRTRERYFHFAIDSFGQRYQAECTPEKRNVSWNGEWKSDVDITQNGWNCKVFIPYKTLGAVLKPGQVWGLNFGRENSRSKRISSWVLLNNFHQVKRFGKLIMLDKNAGMEYELKIAKKIYDTSELQAQIKETSKALSLITKSNQGQAKKQHELLLNIKNIIQAYNKAKDFYEVHKQYLALKNAYHIYENFFVLQQRCANLFKPGSSAAKRGFAILPESSMVKIKPYNYLPMKHKNTRLYLAKNEYGSFQLALIADSGNNIEKVKVSASDLKGPNASIITSKNIKSYLVEYVRTAIPGQEQKEISDLLIPGNEFCLNKVRKTSGIWFDIYISNKVAPGKYDGTMTIRINDNEPVTIQYGVEVYPFSLPSKISLQNIFCFVPEWAEKFYGKKMPPEKRKQYFDFLLKHRLNPVNLWSKEPLLNEQEIKYTISKGSNIISLRPTVSPQYIKMLKNNNYLDKAIFFAGDEVQDRPHKIPELKRLFAKLRQKYPGIPRLCTAWIDPRLYGSIDIWCPRFQQMSLSEKLKQERRDKGEKIWWYFTDGPGAPYANLNLDSTSLEARIIPWMTWKVGANGLLYWAVNREWKTNGGDQCKLSDNAIYTRSIDWLTPQCKKDIIKGKRWPDIPWIPLFMVLSTNRLSASNGGGNIMYPGPDWQPYPSIRLKNLRDGLQDYEYLVLLKKLLVRKRLPVKLRNEITRIIKIEENVVSSPTKYTNDFSDILNEKRKLAALIIKADQILEEK